MARELRIADVLVLTTEEAELLLAAIGGDWSPPAIYRELERGRRVDPFHALDLFIELEERLGERPEVSPAAVAIERIEAAFPAGSPEAEDAEEPALQAWGLVQARKVLLGFPAAVLARSAGLSAERCAEIEADPQGTAESAPEDSPEGAYAELLVGLDRIVEDVRVAVRYRRNEDLPGCD